MSKVAMNIMISDEVNEDNELVCHITSTDVIDRQYNEEYCHKQQSTAESITALFQTLLADHEEIEETFKRLLAKKRKTTDVHGQEEKSTLTD
jgi:hypothetical protein